MGTEYASQIVEKEEQCRALLAGYPDLHWLDPVISLERDFRNKSKMVVGGTVESPTLGILDAKKKGVDLRGCGVLQPGLRDVIPAISDFISLARLEPYDVAARRGELKYVLMTEAPSGDMMLRFVLRSRESISRVRKHLADLQRSLPQARVISVNLQPEHKAIIEGEQEIMLSSSATLIMRTGDIDLRLGAKSFFQTNTVVAEQLYSQAREWAAAMQPRTVWDLYCGVGGFALHLADGERAVTGIEVSPEAIESATASAKDGGLTNIRFIAEDATRFALESNQTSGPDLVVVNPPRRGVGQQLAQWLDKSSVKTVIYSSCNAVTLASDLEAMPSFVPERARILDMFPQTQHYETMVLLTRS